MTTFYYFAYGSNMLTERIKARCPSAEFAGVAYVCGYELHFSKRSKDGSGKATIVENKGHSERLYGALFQIDKSDDLPKLDDAEGNDYERIDDFIVVKTDGDKEIEVTTYFAKSGATNEHLKPYSWYKQLVLWGAIQAELPDSYISQLVAIEAISDLDNERNKCAGEALNGIANCVFSKGTWDMKIADQYTVADWNAMKPLLIPGRRDNWENAFDQFFRKRIETRYFKPIRLLQEHGDDKGEGFSIVAIQCSLIEFLASTRTGKSYKYLKNGGELGKFEYNNSKDVFIEFLTDTLPFKEHFSELAKCFYKNVRCALLHEARTKGKWKIIADSKDNKIIRWTGQNSEKILYRNNLQEAFEKYVDDYGEKLKTCKCLQAAFIRKFDSLCEE
jgi:gamma-glutamyl AIG2-like cyclotransferase